MDSGLRRVTILEVRAGDVYLAPLVNMTFLVSEVADAGMFSRTVTYYAVMSSPSTGAVAVSGPHRVTHYVDDQFLGAAALLRRAGEEEPS